MISPLPCPLTASCQRFFLDYGHKGMNKALALFTNCCLDGFCTLRDLHPRPDEQAKTKVLLSPNLRESDQPTHDPSECPSPGSGLEGDAIADTHWQFLHKPWPSQTSQQHHKRKGRC